MKLNFRILIVQTIVNQSSLSEGCKCWATVSVQWPFRHRAAVLVLSDLCAARTDEPTVTSAKLSAGKSALHVLWCKQFFNKTAFSRMRTDHQNCLHTPLDAIPMDILHSRCLTLGYHTPGYPTPIPYPQDTPPIDIPPSWYSTPWYPTPAYTIP